MNMHENNARKEADALLASVIIEEEQALADALIEITQKHGKFNSDDMGVWAGYESADENENAEIGVKCANCILYEGGSTCKIISAPVEPGGYCRFALIPDGVVKAKPTEEESTEEMSFNCPVCANGCGCSVGPCNCPPTCGCPCRGESAIVILSAASRRAPKKDRVYGSKKNKKGSASGGKKITFSAKTEKTLANKVKEHNEKAPAGRKATLGQLKAVYRRGAGAYSSSHRPGMARDQWAMARVNAYLKLLKSGRPSNPNYKQDNDLLPKAHPKSTNSVESMTASALADTELIIALKDENEYQSPEHAIVAFAEYSGLGYETIPAFRAAWLRAVENNEVPFDRARDLAINLYSSEDADLLPKEYSGLTAAAAVTAALPGGKAWRSAKAKLQRRDRYGRFAEMGGGFSFVFKGKGKSPGRVTGKIVGQSGTENVDVDVKGSDVLPNGTYSVPSKKGEAVKAVISNDALRQSGVDKGKSKSAFPADTPMLTEKDVQKATDSLQEKPKPWVPEGGVIMPGDRPRNLTLPRLIDDDAFKREIEENKKKEAKKKEQEAKKKKRELDFLDYEARKGERPRRGEGVEDLVENPERAPLPKRLSKEEMDALARKKEQERKIIEDQKQMEQIKRSMERLSREPQKLMQGGSEKEESKTDLDLSRPSARQQQEIFGPRKPGGKYKSGYSGEVYEVLDTFLSPTGFPMIMVRGEDGFTRTHSTAWNPKRDKVISEPGD